MAKTPLSVSRFRVLFAGWWLIWAILQALVLAWLDFPLLYSITDSVVTNLLLAASCLLLSHNLKYYLPQKERYGYILMLSLVLSFIWLLLSRVILSFMINQPGYLFFLSRSMPVRFGIAFLLIACMAMISVVWYTTAEQNENDKRRTEAEKLAREAELYKLRQQLQPHFLFNSLNSMNALIGSKPDEARVMIQQLSDFLRGTLRKEEQQWVSLSEEMEYLELYLAIEKVRFGHRLATVSDLEPASLHLKLPNMLLQPIVENAIKFSLYETTGEITIRILARAEHDQLIITVQNPFDAASPGSRPGTGFGLNSVQRRLLLLYARNDLLATTADGDVFTTVVKIPQRLQL